MIQVDLHDPALRAQWAATRNLRIEGFLQEPLAQALLAELRELPHKLALPTVPRLKYQMACHENYPDPACEHPVCRFVHFWLGEGREQLSQFVGEALDAPPSGMVLSTLYTKGCYLDPHNDQEGSRALAFVLGLTEDSWPAEEGGWLEFLGYGPEGVRVVERRPPGWNTLDLFDVRLPGRIHRIPMLLQHRERRVLSGWFHVG